MGRSTNAVVNTSFDKVKGGTKPLAEDDIYQTRSSILLSAYAGHKIATPFIVVE